MPSYQRRRQVDRTSYIEIFHDQHQIGNRLDVRLDGNVLQRPYRLLAGLTSIRSILSVPAIPCLMAKPSLTPFAPFLACFVMTLNVPDTRPEFETRTTQFAFFTEGLLRATDRFKLVAGLRGLHRLFPRRPH